MGQKFKLNFAISLGENDLNSEKGGIYESPPDRYVPSSSPAKNDSQTSQSCNVIVVKNFRPKGHPSTNGTNHRQNGYGTPVGVTFLAFKKRRAEFGAFWIFLCIFPCFHYFSVVSCLFSTFVAPNAEGLSNKGQACQVIILSSTMFKKILSSIWKSLRASCTILRKVAPLSATPLPY